METLKTKTTLSASELRLGNWVYDGEKKRNCIIAEIRETAVLLEPTEYGGTKLSWLRPIPLSPDILLSAGFVESKTMRGYIKSYNRKDEEDGEGKIVISHSIDFNCYMVSVGRNESIVNLNQISYLHQLQNLYFALTGEELTINI